MKWSTIAAAATGLVGTAAAQAESVPYTDAETGITFQQYPSEDGIQFRVALPELIEPSQPYDVILQIEAPKSIGWVGWAWAGQMTYNPLTLVWANGDQVVHSSRMAFGYSPPTPYADATYQVLKGTGIKGDTLKFTALCKGCSSWMDFTGEPTTVDSTQEARFAYAHSSKPVAEPANNASSFSIHDGVGHWYHDLPAAKNPAFNTWVAKNTISPNGTSLSLDGVVGVSGLGSGLKAPLRFMERIRRELGADARN
ncbi:Cellobiose dehydrogenase [Apiospora aurea]|uniref:Cellobiose dehydrogenase n=1 Tax=Apiospora aurea TaxID=335848 RepID=A0ABR1QNN6_9PEZI